MKKIASFSTLVTYISIGVSSIFQSAYAQSDQLVPSDMAIVDMQRAYQQKNQALLDELLPKTVGNVLEPWAAYWQLSNRLETASSKEIVDFLEKYKDTYQADSVRVAWLNLLGKRHEWREFLRIKADYRMNDDPDVYCYNALANYEMKRKDDAQGVESTWMNIKQIGPACLMAVATLYKRHQMPAQTIWLKVREGMDISNLSMAENAVSILSPPLTEPIKKIYEHPKKFLKGKMLALTYNSKELTILALTRLARTDYQAAETYMSKLRWKLQLSNDDKAWLWGAIGKRAAQSFDPNALRFFEHDKLERVYPEHLTWMVRAALLAGKWSLVLKGIDAMPDSLSDKPEWVYWRAIAIKNESPKNDKMVDSLMNERATKLFKKIANTTDYYGLLALNALGEPIEEPAPPKYPSTEAMEQARRNPNLIQALYAYKLGLRSEGMRTWNFATNLYDPGGMNDQNLLAAAMLACENEIWDRCINTSDRTKSFVDMKTRYPMPFESLVVERSDQINLDPAFVYGLIRQESRFIAAARSNVGAQGLMQVMPATAKWTARKLGMTDFSMSQMNNKRTNIAIGTGYLKLVLNSFDGAFPLAAAAYNAGPRRPIQWLTAISNPKLSGAIWVENIPFHETRDYVKKVLANTVNYSLLIHKKADSIEKMLTQVRLGSPSNQAQALSLP